MAPILLYRTNAAGELGAYWIMNKNHHLYQDVRGGTGFLELLLVCAFIGLALTFVIRVFGDRASDKYCEQAEKVAAMSASGGRCSPSGSASGGDLLAQNGLERPPSPRIAAVGTEPPSDSPRLRPLLAPSPRIAAVGAEPETTHALAELLTNAVYEMFPSTPFVEGASDSHPIHPNDVAQGLVGDCWLHAGLAAIADANPDLIQQAIRENPDGTYAVTLWNYKSEPGSSAYEGSSQEFTVSPGVPVLAEDLAVEVLAQFGLIGKRTRKAGDWAFAQPGDIDTSGDRAVYELWPTLFEKAMIEFLENDPGLGPLLNEDEKGYASLHFGFLRESLRRVAGRFDEYRTTSSYEELYGSTSYERLNWREMMKWWREGYAITVASHDGYEVLVDNKGRLPEGLKGAVDEYYESELIVFNHGYWVSDIDPVARTITVRNPWGWEHGPLVMSWSDFEAAFRDVDGVPTGRPRQQVKSWPDFSREVDAVPTGRPHQ